MFAYNTIMCACISRRERRGQNRGRHVRFREGHARTPKIRFAVAVSPPPVPRCLAGNTSGEAAYNTPNIICKQRGTWWVKQVVVRFTHVTKKNAYPQFHPSSAGELRAVVPANRNAPVRPGFAAGSLNKDSPENQGRTCPRRQPKSHAARRMKAQRTTRR
jgi:hypothetical protein